MNKKILQGRQYRNMQVEIKQDEEMIVEGYATTFNSPYTLYSDDMYEIREQVSDKALSNTDLSDVIMQYDHRDRVFARTSNNTLSLLPDAQGLLIRANLGGTEIGRNLFEEIKGGYTTKMSFGFTVDEETIEEFKEGDKRIYLRTITSIKKIYDVSAVSLPANDATEISARTYCDGVIAEAEAERLLKAEKERQLKVETIKRKLQKMRLEGV